MATCRCPMCGKNNGSRKSSARGVYIAHGLGRDEHNRGWGGDKRYERKTLRTRLKRETARLALEGA